MIAPRLLMCDDEAAIGAFVRHIAEELGYSMHFTTDAEDFGSLYRQVDPQVVILDLVMPGTDGIELLRFLAKQRSRARILLMSGFDPRIRDAARLLGEAHSLDMAGVVAKPVRAAELRRLLAGLGSGLGGGLDGGPDGG
ncbi:response regulator [Pelagibius sp. CAU 1746]|uniref:response regulator n=1 Tax=Pelagibius sp. CAU 1746 TaxID=3140370 RepID=UPI00325C2F5E